MNRKWERADEKEGMYRKWERADEKEVILYIENVKGQRMRRMYRKSERPYLG